MGAELSPAQSDTTDSEADTAEITETTHIAQMPQITVIQPQPDGSSEQENTTHIGEGTNLCHDSLATALNAVLHRMKKGEKVNIIEFDNIHQCINLFLTTWQTLVAYFFKCNKQYCNF